MAEDGIQSDDMDIIEGIAHAMRIEYLFGNGSTHWLFLLYESMYCGRVFMTGNGEMKKTSTASSMSGPRFLNPYPFSIPPETPTAAA
jgi:hypothetical protein